MAALILYGSWFPFHWIHPHPDEVWWALTNLDLFTGRGDLLGNVVLFLPWGFATANAATARGGRPWVWALVGGAGLAMLRIHSCRSSSGPAVMSLPGWSASA